LPQSHRLLVSKIRNIGGISQTAAMKSSDLNSKCQYLDEITGGKGVVFATGTPVSNSVAELYTMQRYLQRNTLKKNGLINFDAWASTFGETVTTIELAPEGTGYRAKTRFSKFHNLTELMTMFKECADVVTRDDIAGKGGLELPDVERTVVTVKASEFQKKYIEGFAERADNIRNGTVDPHIDNMLKITSDGRKLALDQRLIDGNLPEDDNGKVAACASNMYKIWNETSDAKLTQLAFCDISTPSDSFNVYDALRNKLVDMGIPKNEVAFIHEYPKEKDKEKLFAQVKRGDVRILVGSTAKLGTGTNVQEKMIAVHHLDCPYRPADMEQREGRVIRQGNDNKKVGIFTYITEGTFDSYMFQMLETKQKFISQIMNSKSPARVGNDVDDAALNYAEIKALASGNPRIKEKMELDMDVARLQSLKSSFKTQHYSLQDQVLKELPMQISAIEQRIKGELKDIATIKDSTVIVADGISPMIINGKSYNTRKEAGEALLAAVKNMKNGNEVEIGSYKGLKLSLSYDTLNKSFTLTSKGAISYFTMLGSDASGNITRLDNTLNFIENDLSRSKERLENSKSQLTIAKEELDKPFTYEAELKEKISRLNELNAELNLDKNVGDTLAAEIEEAPAEEAAEHKSLDDKIDKAIDTAAALNDSHNIEPTKLADREL
ncbi:MAG: helicase-related protein, partial [Eubacteriales bacterium]|nr:helicase-related protein [Eubacteriales bacterium]